RTHHRPGPPTPPDPAGPKGTPQAPQRSTQPPREVPASPHYRNVDRYQEGQVDEARERHLERQIGLQQKGREGGYPERGRVRPKDRDRPVSGSRHVRNYELIMNIMNYE